MLLLQWCCTRAYESCGYWHGSELRQCLWQCRAEYDRGGVILLQLCSLRKIRGRDDDEEIQDDAGVDGEDVEAADQRLRELICTWMVYKIEYISGGQDERMI